ncbi:MAG: outer membrane lipoprotein chaperone LolA [Gammaproteobacteria bacterium]|nr:outer membrane lipoprotein chaperone LolA [Gammaproteobacteria bacterium]
MKCYLLAAVVCSWSVALMAATPTTEEPTAPAATTAPVKPAKPTKSSTPAAPATPKAPVLTVPISSVRSLEHFFAEIRSYSATFQQVVLDESGKQVQESKGRLWIERPSKFRWNYESPTKQQIVCDGEHLWMYDEDLRQVVVRSLENGLQDTPAMLLSGKGRLDQQFVIKDLGTENKMEWVQLLPKNKDKDASFDKIRLGFEQGGLRVIELHDNFGQTTRYTLRNVQENAALDASRFDFTPPKGADIVSQP